MYIIDVNNGEQQFWANDYKEALEFSHTLEKEDNPDSIEIIRSTDATLCWTNKDSPALRQYTELDAEQWLNLEKGMKEASDKPSIYFDIDGTLGYFYQDARGMVYPDEVLDPKTHYFRDIEPHPFIIDLARSLQEKGYDVCVISAADKDTIRDKYEWLKENCGFINDENICFCPLGADKTEFVKGNAEKSILVDDYPKNLSEWKGIPVKAVNSINSVDKSMLCIKGYEIESDISRAGEWNELIEEMVSNVIISLGDEITLPHIDRHKFLMNEKEYVIDTTQLSESNYVTSVIDKRGEVYKEVVTSSYNEAIKAHAEVASYYDNLEDVSDFSRVMSHHNDLSASNTSNEKIGMSVEDEEKRRLYDELCDVLPQLLKDVNYGSNVITISSFSYDDKLSSEQILNCYNNYCNYGMNEGYANFEAYLEYYVDDVLWEYREEVYSSLIADIKKGLPDRLYEIFDDYVDELGDYGVLEDIAKAEVEIDTYSYIDECHINLMFATRKELNFDNGAIHDAFNSNIGDINVRGNEEYYKDSLDNSLSYVIHQQGHTIKEVYEALYSDKNNADNNFVKSVVNELDGMTYSMSNVTALTSCGGKDLINLLDSIAHKKSDIFISLPTTTEIGLYNEWLGSGSALEISLEKPLVIPADMVRNVQFESTSSNDRVSKSANNGYSVDDTYSLVHSVWTKSNPTLTSEPPSLLQEDVRFCVDYLKYRQILSEGAHFYYDVDKMMDMRIIADEEQFLNSYSYLTLDEYEATVAIVNYKADELALNIVRFYELSDEAGSWSFDEIRGKLSDLKTGADEAVGYYKDILDYKESFSNEISPDESNLLQSILAEIDKFQVIFTDSMIDVSNFTVEERVELAEQYRCTEQLIKDEDSGVRMAVARQGRPQDLDVLVNDENADVRVAVAEQGRPQDLAILENDDDNVVREKVRQYKEQHPDWDKTNGDVQKDKQTEKESN